jgi:hypothetical protein
MTDRPVVMAVASYRSKAGAEADVRAIEEGVGSWDQPSYAIALVEKGADGRLTLDRHFCAPDGPEWQGAILAGALTVVAAPIGIMFLVAVAHSVTVLGGVGAIAGRFWNDLPKHQLSRMSDLIEAGQAALLVVAAGDACEGIEEHLTGAWATALATTHADLTHEYQVGVEESGAFG